jgi:hypothetical protein
MNAADLAELYRLGRPSAAERSQFKREAIAAVRYVRAAKAVHYTAADKKKLRRAACTINKVGAQLAALHLPEAAALKELSKSVTAQADKLSIKRSGGGKAARAAYAQKYVAAQCAFDLINDYGLNDPTSRGPPPRLTIGGAYFTLASKLYELATGRSADLDRACVAYVQALRAAEDYPSPAILRAWRQTSKAL